TIYSKFDKTAINALPQAVFPGRITVLLTEKDAEKAVDYLLEADLLGIDSETRPSFRRGEMRQVALLQVSTRDTCFLFRLNLMGLCPPVVRLLENTRVPMVGLSLHDDITALRRRGVFNEGKFIDLQDIVGGLGIEDLSLQKLWANFFSQRISKRQQLSNWEAPVLSDRQKQYAALDAWACLRLYEEITRLETTGDYRIEQPAEEEPEYMAQIP
ncbi:MAG: 3'-5' exonuclease domain-containing protein 2, partial [Prevotella sp.]|nr:3'-5' exonuclease domain-containing protein 2 [Prevotella sp.]